MRFRQWRTRRSLNSGISSATSIVASHISTKDRRGFPQQRAMSAAWFMSHRIREAMATGGLDPFGSDGGMVEVDETYIGRKAGMEVRKGGAHRSEEHTS